MPVAREAEKLFAALPTLLNFQQSVALLLHIHVTN